MNSPTVTVRLSPLLLSAVKHEVKQSQSKKQVEPLTMTRFVEIAIIERLAKLSRDRTRKRRTRSPARRQLDTAD